MCYVWMALLAGGILGLDQLTKYLVIRDIPLGGYVEAIPGLFHLTHVHNTGAAFSILEGMQWLFLVIFLLFAGVLVWEFTKKQLGLMPFERWCLVAVFGGGLGNMVDRLRWGYVVDMIRVEFMDFPIFNVADCFITCGCVLLLGHLVLVNKNFWKGEKSL